MFKLTKLVKLATGLDDAKKQRVVDALRTAGGLGTRAILEPTFPGVYNGGDFIWHVQFKDEAACRAATAGAPWSGAAGAVLADKTLVEGVESVAYAGGRRGERSGPGGVHVYRTLLLSILPRAAENIRARFETELFAMPDYIKSMFRWQLSRVSEASGSRVWTHVWEQEYPDIGGLQGPYMMHPYHWGHIDRWFDPECTDWIVDTHLCHTFCEVKGPVI